MGTLSNSRNISSITFLDISLILLLLMSWILVSQVWADPIVNTMLTLSAVGLVLYIIAKFTGFLNFMKLTIPTWTISGLISLPIWYFYLTIIPTSGGTGASSLSDSITEGVLSRFFNPDSIVRFMQIIMFPSTESLWVIFLFAFFLGVALRKHKGVLQGHQSSAIGPLVIVSAFWSLLHSSVAEKLQKSGVIDFDISLWQQFLSFFIFIATGIVFLAPGIVSSHVVKNLIVFGDATWFIGIFLIFILLDVLSVTLSKTAKPIDQKKYFT